MLARELLVGVTLGAILGVVGVISTLAWESTRFIGMVLTISLSVIGVVTVGALIGSGVPLLLQRLKIDPAVASTPFITSMVDIAGLIIFFEIARLFLE